MKNLYTIGLVFSLLFLNTACNEPTNEEIIENDTFAAILEFPVDVIPCSAIPLENRLLTGKNIVTFEWEEANEKIDYYNLFLINNNTLELVILRTTNTSMDVEVEVNTSYSWYVNTFFENNPLTKTSLTSNFMIESSSFSVHPPNAAMPNNPKRGERIDSGFVNLSWECTDRDDDIIHYEVILDTKYPPIQAIGITENTELAFSVDSDTIYYWMINAEDSQGNITSSEVFQFRTNGNNVN